MKMTPRMTTLHEESHTRDLPPLLNMAEEEEEEEEELDVSCLEFRSKIYFS